MPRQYDFPVILQDVDYMSKIKLVSFTDKILSAAGMDADRLGFGVGDLNIENCTWVLSRFAVQTQTMPRVGDRLSISTWINQYGRVLTTRNFIITNQNGAEIAKAITLWAMLDIKRRTPVDLSHIEEALRHTEPEPSPIEQPMRIKTTGLPVLAKHNVAYSDIDFNGHVSF